MTIHPLYTCAYACINQHFGYDFGYGGLPQRRDRLSIECMCACIFKHMCVSEVCVSVCVCMCVCMYARVCIGSIDIAGTGSLYIK